MGCGASSAKVAIAPPDAPPEERATALRALLEHSADENHSAEELRGKLRLAQSILYLMDDDEDHPAASEGGMSFAERMTMGSQAEPSLQQGASAFEMATTPRAETSEEIVVEKEKRHQSVVDEPSQETERTVAYSGGKSRPDELIAVCAGRSCTARLLRPRFRSPTRASAPSRVPLVAPRRAHPDHCRARCVPF